MIYQQVQNIPFYVATPPRVPKDYQESNANINKKDIQKAFEKAVASVVSVETRTNREISEASDETLDEAKEYARQQDAITLAAAKADATTKADKALEDAKADADTQDAELTTYVTTLMDQKDTALRLLLEAFINRQDDSHLAEGKTYTNTEINKVKNLIDNIQTGLIGHSIDADGNLILNFNDGTSETINLSTLLSDEIAAIELRLDAIEEKNSELNHFVRVVRKEGTSVGDKDYYVENTTEIVQTDEYYIVNPAGGGNIPAANNGDYAIKGSDGTITYTAPSNGDTAFIYADRQVDITDGDGNVSTSNENRIVAILIYEGGRWIITNSFFKNANDCTESGTFANAEGLRNTASGDYSHAEGFDNNASGRGSHAEGSENTASGLYAHAEGSKNNVSGDFAHAEGGTNFEREKGNTASGISSHAEGRENNATANSSHAEGRRNTVNVDYGHIQGYRAVLADPDSLFGIGYGDHTPTTDERNGSEDVGLVYKVDKFGNSTQTGKVKAASFELTDGTVIDGSGSGSGTTDLDDYSTTAEIKEFIAEEDEKVKNASRFLLSSWRNESGDPFTTGTERNIGSLPVAAKSGSPTWETADGGYVEMSKGRAVSGIYWENDEIDFDRFSLTVNINAGTVWRQHEGLVLFFGGSDTPANSAAFWNQRLGKFIATFPANSGAELFTRWAGGANNRGIITQANSAPTSADWTDGNDHQLRYEIWGKTIRVYFDGKLIGTMDTPAPTGSQALTGGRFGFMVETQGTATRRLRDIFITQATIASAEPDLQLPVVSDVSKAGSTITFNRRGADDIDIETLVLPTIGEPGQQILLKAKNVNGKTIMLGATPNDMTAELNSISDSASQTIKLGGHVIKDNTIDEANLTTAVQNKLNTAARDGESAIDSLVYDRKWTAQAKTFDSETIPVSPANVGLSFSSRYARFIFPNNLNKEDIDALVINRRFALEFTSGVIITFTPTAYSKALVLSGHVAHEYEATFDRTGAVTADERVTLYRENDDDLAEIKKNAAEIAALKARTVKEKSVRVFANRALKFPTLSTGSSAEGWRFAQNNRSFLNVGRGTSQESGETPEEAASTTVYKGISIDIPKERWNIMQKIVGKASHANQVVSSTFAPIYKDDMVAGTKYLFGYSGSGRIKAMIWFEEDKNQLGDRDTTSNRLVIEMTAGGTTGWYIGEILLQHLEIS